MKALVIGGAGFIGSHLCDELVKQGEVTVFDDLSSGRREFLSNAEKTGRLRFNLGDARNLDQLSSIAPGHDIVFHLAANPEARRALENPRIDLELGTIATFNALEITRLCKIPRFVLASSGTVYGVTNQRCAEDHLGSLPISLYGASKLACEAMVSAYVECFGLQAVIYRFGNVVGPRGTHGAALDFLKKLKANHHQLEVLGDGKQEKPYLHVNDCVRGILHGLNHTQSPLSIFNIAPHSTTAVSEIAQFCVALSPYPNATINYTGGSQGWRGDVPRSEMDSTKLLNTGYQFTYTSSEAVKASIKSLVSEVFGD